MSISKMHLPLISLLLCFSCCTVIAEESPIETKPKVIIGFPAFDGDEHFVTSSNNLLNATSKHLVKSLPQYEFEFRYFLNEEIKKQVIDQKLDFFLMPSGIFRILSAYGALPLANLVAREAPNPNNGVAGVFIVRRDSGIRTIKSTKGMTVAGTGPEKFMSWQIPFGKIADLGFDPEKFYKKAVHVGSDLTMIPKLVRSGEVDVGVMRSCTLEIMMKHDPQKFSDLRVLEPQPYDGLRCMHSTSGYPGMTFGAVNNTRNSRAWYTEEGDFF